MKQLISTLFTGDSRMNVKAQRLEKLNGIILCTYMLVAIASVTLGVVSVISTYAEIMIPLIGGLMLGVVHMIILFTIDTVDPEYRLMREEMNRRAKLDELEPYINQMVDQKVNDRLNSR